MKPLSKSMNSQGNRLYYNATHRANIDKTTVNTQLNLKSNLTSPKQPNAHSHSTHVTKIAKGEIHFKKFIANTPPQRGARRREAKYLATIFRGYRNMPNWETATPLGIQRIIRV